MANAKPTKSNNETSQLARLRRRARGALLTAAISVCLLLVILAASVFLGLFAFDQHQTLARHNARELVAASESARQNGDPTLATLLALEALPKADQRNGAQPVSSEAEAALYRSLSQMTERRRYDGVAEYAATSERAVAALQSEAQIRFVDVVTDREFSQIAVASDDVVELELSSDATKSAIVHKDRTVTIWDVAAGAQISRFAIEGEEEQPYVRFFADATTLSYLSSQSTTGNSHRSLIDVATGTKISIDSHTEFLGLGSLRHVEGRRWLTARSVDNKFLLVDFDQKTVVAELTGPFGSWVESATSADGRWVAFANSDHDFQTFTGPALVDGKENPVFVLDLVEGTIAHKFDGLQYGVDSLSFGENNEFLIGASDGRYDKLRIVKWGLETGDVVAEKIFDRWISDPIVQILPGEQDIFVAGSGYRAIWTSDLQSIKAPLAGQHSMVWRVHTDPKSKAIVVDGTGGYTSFYRTYDYGMTAERQMRGSHRQELKVHPFRSYVSTKSVPLGESKRYALISRSASWVEVLTPYGKLIDRIGSGGEGVYRAAEYAGGEILVLYEKGGRISVHTARPGISPVYVQRLTGSDARTSFSSSGNRFAVPVHRDSGGGSQQIEIYGGEGQWEKQTEFEIAGNPSKLAFGHTEDDLIGTAWSHGSSGASFFHYHLTAEKLRVLPMDGVQYASTILPVPGKAAALIFLNHEEGNSKDGWYLFTYDETAIEWDTERKFDEIELEKFAVVRGRYAISDGEDRVHIIDLETLSLNAVQKDAVTKELDRFDVSFDGKFLVGSGFNARQIWDLTTGELLKPKLFEASEQDQINDIYFARNSHRLIFFAETRVDGPYQIVIGDLSSDRVVRRLGPYNGSSAHLELSPNEDFILVSELGREVLLEAETGLPLRTWEDVLEMKFAPSGKHLICSCAGGQTIIPILPRGEALIYLARENLPPHRSKLTQEELVPFSFEHRK